ncbi:hypothetical protein CPLU01_04320 [Colletotrichum plurivorum]|uniref:Uncharacterized protein n=1 Tax=Colletotrichum plurivorum TaxID=2175906 RepID=A0A8H6KPP7_9PEZI|nr:hypothetical protein CPLU01_04320 [Colletotrichum plurivorum]
MRASGCRWMGGRRRSHSDRRESSSTGDFRVLLRQAKDKQTTPEAADGKQELELGAVAGERRELAVAPASPAITLIASPEFLGQRHRRTQANPPTKQAGPKSGDQLARL